MSKKGTKALASATLMSLVLTTALSAGPVQAAAGQATRVGEVDRYATAAKVATTNWTTSDNVVLVSGEGYADAVSASALAKKLNAPILLTTKGVLGSDAKAALATLKAKNVYVVGGEASVSSSVRAELKATYSLVELGGNNRYETNAAVAQKLVDLGVSASDVVMVGGEGFADALSVAPVAATKGQILLLGMNDANYMKPVLDFIAKNKSKVTVVGTSNVISDSILNTVGGTRVNGGKDRWDTNQKVLAAFKDVVKFDKLYVASASYNANDDGYADALVASALAGKYAAPLLLVDKDGSEGTTNALAYIKANASKTTDLQVVGGTGVVSDSTLNAVTAAAGGTVVTPGDATVKSIEALNLNQFKVVYNTNVDEDSAEDVTNYKFDGTTFTTAGAISAPGVLKDTNAVAVLQDDKRTVMFTMYKSADQYKDITLSVKKAVLNADKTSTIPAFDQKVTFSDTAVPTLKSVSVQGSNKLTVEFSEAVNMGSLTKLAQKIKIDGQSLSSYDVNLDNYSSIDDAITSGSTIAWSSKVEFYFNTPLPSGNHTLKVSDGDKDVVLYDAAKFVFKEATMDFNVEAVTTKPVIKEVRATADGKVYVTFDRPMDKKTALDASYYQINNRKLDDLLGANPDTYLSFDDGSNDCTVKIKGLSGQYASTDKINTGANVIYVTDDVKDAYGNKIDDDTRANFTLAKDETKPTITSVNMIDSETIRVRFSKDIDYNYAKDLTNYTLKDSSNLDITSHIKEVKNSTSAGSNGDTFDIKMYNETGKDYRLTGSKYTLTIKGLKDTTSNGNVMDEYTTTLTGSDDVAPKVTRVYKKTDTKPKVVVYFSEAMDTDTLVASNFKFKNGSNDAKDLPSSCVISVSSDNKAVTIEFPTNYKINDGSSDDTNVKGIVASSVKDESGNLIDSFSNSQDISTQAGEVALKDNCYRIQYDGDDILVKVQYDGAIDPDTLDKNDFKVAGETPDGISVSGSDLVLRFSSTSNATSITHLDELAGYTGNSLAGAKVAKKVDVVKYAGTAARYTTTSSAADMTTSDEAGIPVATNTSIAVYDNYLAPKTTSDYWYATTVSSVSLNVTTEGGIEAQQTSAAAIVLTFDTQLYDGSGITPDSFKFNIGGTTIKADKVKVNNNTLVFLFRLNGYTDAVKTAFNTSGTSIDVSLDNNKVPVLKALKDLDGNYTQYAPSDDDKTKTRNVKVQDTAVPITVDNSHWGTFDKIQ